MPNPLFTSLLAELSRAQLENIVNLRPNEFNTCVIPLPGGTSLRIELDKDEKNIMLLSTLGVLRPGHYRFDIFREALKANALPQSQKRILAYSIKTEELVLHEFLDLRGLTGQEIAEHVPPFLETVKLWREAIAGANLPNLTASYSSLEPKPFGLKF